jgi:HK97 family phage prohead protease
VIAHPEAVKALAVVDGCEMCGTAGNLSARGLCRGCEGKVGRMLKPEGDRSMIVTKAVALVDTVETEDPNGAFEVILSAATLDRDGEVIDSRAFDPLPDHIPFDIDHGMTVTTTVGSGAPYYADDGTLRVKGTFASTPLAQEVRTLVSEGHVRTTSVTFMAADREPDEKGVNHVKTAELLNGTFTPVPSNRESVVLSRQEALGCTPCRPPTRPRRDLLPEEKVERPATREGLL